MIGALRYTRQPRSRKLGHVHTTLKEIKNAALFLWLPSTLIRHENGDFRKRSSDRKNLKTPASFFVDGKLFKKTELFENHACSHDNQMISQASFTQTQIQHLININSSLTSKLNRFDAFTFAFKCLRRSLSFCPQSFIRIR